FLRCIAAREMIGKPFGHGADGIAFQRFGDKESHFQTHQAENSCSIACSSPKGAVAYTQKVCEKVPNCVPYVSQRPAPHSMLQPYCWGGGRRIAKVSNHSGL